MSSSTMFNGQRWRLTHQASVDSILGARVRRVRSFGSSFYNKDNWVARSFVASMVQWAAMNGGRTPEHRDVEGWVRAANHMKLSEEQKEIVIASTPDELPLSLAHALVGGAYHEAWHTLYSRTKPLEMKDVWPRITEVWEKIPDKTMWAKLMPILLHWSNLIEDIRIERLGNSEFPGTIDKMEALQDFILEQESEEHPQAGAKVEVQVHTVIAATFRDLGLGYDTPNQDLALKKYKALSADAFEYVKNGPLTEVLEKSINLGKDDLGSFWLAFEVVTALIVDSLVKEEEKEEGEGEEQGEGGEGEGSGEASGGGKPQKGSKGSGKKGPRGPKLFQVGDMATLKAGPNQGRKVKVTRAGLPHPVTGVQDLEFELLQYGLRN